MTGAKAVWELAESVDKADPFAAVVYSTGITLDLTATEDALAELYCDLLLKEGRLDKRGLSCDLKWNGQNCLHCPVAVLDPNDPMATLCRLGKDQQTVEDRCNELAAARTAAIAELAAVADEASEIGHMPEELIELLTEAGP